MSARKDTVPTFRCGRGYSGDALRRFLMSKPRYDTASGNFTPNATVWLCQVNDSRRSRHVVKKVIVFTDAPGDTSEDAEQAVSECMRGTP